MTHYPALDGVRGVAILMVFLVHGHATPELWGSLLVAQMHHGVTLFFVLSGFLIGTILLRTRGSPDYLRKFWWNRVVRIAPAFYVALPILWLAGVRFGWDLPFYISNWRAWTETVDPTRHFWSLAVEEQWYLWLPLLVMASNRRLPLALFAIILASGTWRSVCDYSGLGIDPYHWTTCRLDALACGALLAVAWRSEVVKRGLSRWMPPVGLGAALVGSVTTLMAESWLCRSVGWTCWIVASVGFVCAALNPRPPRWLCGQFLREVGCRAYGLYIWHYPISLLVCSQVKSWPQPTAYWVSVAVTFALARMAAGVSWVLVEKPALRWRNNECEGGTRK